MIIRTAGSDIALDRENSLPLGFTQIVRSSQRLNKTIDDSKIQNDFFTFCLS